MTRFEALPRDQTSNAESCQEGSRCRFPTPSGERILFLTIYVLVSITLGMNVQRCAGTGISAMLADPFFKALARGKGEGRPVSRGHEPRLTPSPLLSYDADVAVPNLA